MAPTCDNSLVHRTSFSSQMAKELQRRSQAGGGRGLLWPPQDGVLGWRGGIIGEELDAEPRLQPRHRHRHRAAARQEGAVRGRRLCGGGGGAADEPGGWRWKRGHCGHRGVQPRQCPQERVRGGGELGRGERRPPPGPACHLAPRAGVRPRPRQHRPLAPASEESEEDGRPPPAPQRQPDSSPGARHTAGLTLSRPCSP